MVMLDGAFTLYLPILKLLEPHLKPGALIIGENAFEQASGYIDYVRDPQNGYLSLPLSFDPGRGNEFQRGSTVTRAVAPPPPGRMTRTLLRWLMLPARVAAVETLSPHFRLVDLEGEALRTSPGRLAKRSRWRWARALARGPTRR